jgi:hypothetical protein
MIIPNQLPQFKGETALLVVSGAKQAKIYRASDSVLEVLDECKVETPKYSDKEGFFASTSRDGSTSAGSILNDVEKEAERSFMNELAVHLKSAGKVFSNSVVYVFAPSHVKNMVMRKIPAALKNNVRFVMSGNYAKMAPLTVLEKIKKITDLNKVMALSEDVERILSLPRQSPSGA